MWKTGNAINRIHIWHKFHWLKKLCLGSLRSNFLHHDNEHDLLSQRTRESTRILKIFPGSGISLKVHQTIHFGVVLRIFPQYSTRDSIKIIPSGILLEIPPKLPVTFVLGNFLGIPSGIVPQIFPVSFLPRPRIPSGISQNITYGIVQCTSNSSQIFFKNSFRNFPDSTRDYRDSTKASYLEIIPGILQRFF